MIEDAILLLGLGGVGYYLYRQTQQAAPLTQSAIDTALAYGAGINGGAIPATPASVDAATIGSGIGTIWGDLQQFFMGGTGGSGENTVATTVNGGASGLTAPVQSRGAGAFWATDQNFAPDPNATYLADPTLQSNDTGSGSVLDIAKQNIIAHEGQRFDAYYDNLGVLTCGVGHKVTTNDGLKLGDTVGQGQIDAWLSADLNTAYNAALNQAADLNNSDPKFIAALVEVNFQLGTGWPKVLYGTYALLKQGHVAQAVQHLYATKWYNQTPDRVENFVQALNSTNFGVA